MIFIHLMLMYVVIGVVVTCVLNHEGVSNPVGKGIRWVEPIFIAVKVVLESNTIRERTPDENQ